MKKTQVLSLLLAILFLITFVGCSDTEKTGSISTASADSVIYTSYFDEKTNKTETFQDISYQIPSGWEGQLNPNNADQMWYATPEGNLMQIGFIGNSEDIHADSFRDGFIKGLSDSKIFVNQQDIISVNSSTAYRYTGHTELSSEDSPCVLVMFSVGERPACALISSNDSDKCIYEKDFQKILDSVKPVDKRANDKQEAQSTLSDVASKIQDEMKLKFDSVKIVDGNTSENSALIISVQSEKTDAATIVAFFNCAANSIENSSFASSVYSSISFSLNNSAMVLISRNPDDPTLLTSGLYCLDENERVDELIRLAYDTDTYFSSIDSDKYFEQKRNDLKAQYGIKD